MAKSLKDKNETIEFTYKGKDFSVPIEASLMLNDMSVDEIKEHLNEIPARQSYWKAMQVTLEREIADMEEDFEVWYQNRYMDIDEEHAKRTEKWKAGKVMLENVDEWKKKKSALRDLQDVNKKVAVLVSGYNTMTWTLREIARLTHAEISNLSAQPRSKNLADTYREE